MSIRKIRIEGFRSLRDAMWEPGKLNVVIGPNGSGKSNLLRALALLQKSATGSMSEEILRLGGIAVLLWDRQANELAWTVEVDPMDNVKETLIYEIRLRQLGMSSSYRIEREQLRITSDQNDRDVLHRNKRIQVERGSLEDSYWQELPILHLAGDIIENRQFSGFRAVLAGWSIYHDIHVDQQAPVRQAAIARMDRQVASDGQNLVPVLHTLYTGSRDFKKLVDDAMRVAFSKDYEELVFPPAADQRVQLRIRWRSLKTEQSAADLSDGTIRFLLLLAILGNPTPGALIAIDEPEVGLHPGMLPLVAELAVEASERTQVILTTHSPQLLDAFTATPPTTTVARCIDGETHLSVIDGDELRRWLSEYSLGALFRSGELEGMV